MGIDAVSDNIYADWGRDEMIDDFQELMLVKNVKEKNTAMMQPIIDRLRALGERLKKQSTDEVVHTFECLKQGLLYDADTHLTKAIRCEWEAAATLAQANRIQNLWRIHSSPYITRF